MKIAHKLLFVFGEFQRADSFAFFQCLAYARQDSHNCLGFFVARARLFFESGITFRNGFKIGQNKFHIDNANVSSGVD